jgi:hypothetical protein
MKTTHARGSAMLAALAAIAVSAALAAALADFVRTELVVAVQRRAAARALAAVDRCLAVTLAAMPPGWGFETLLAGADRLAGTADDGVVPAPPGCTASARLPPAPPSPPRILLTVDASAGGGRRALQAVVGRLASPAPPALLWLSQAPPSIPGNVVLEGTDLAAPAAPARATLAAPVDPPVLDAWLVAEAAHVTVAAGTAAALASPAPPLGELVERARTAGAVDIAALGPVAGAPALVLGHDVVVSDLRAGAGFLVIEGGLDVTGELRWSGVVAAGGLRVGAGGLLAVDGAVWVGPRPVVVGGGMRIRHSGSALATADALLPLPRPATLRGLRDLG